MSALALCICTICTYKFYINRNLNLLPPSLRHENIANYLYGTFAGRHQQVRLRVKDLLFVGVQIETSGNYNVPRFNYERGYLKHRNETLVALHVYLLAVV